MANENVAFGWDDEVEVVDSGTFQLLDEGPATFTVTAFKRGRFEGSAKMSACHQAELTICCTDPAGHVSDVGVKLPLNKKMLWKISSFFKSIGLIPADMQSGATTRYPWQRVVGTRGICMVSNRTYEGNDGEDHETNQVDSFLFGAKADAELAKFGERAVQSTTSTVANQPAKVQPFGATPPAAFAAAPSQQSFGAAPSQTFGTAPAQAFGA